MGSAQDDTSPKKHHLQRPHSIGGITKRSRGQATGRQHMKKPYSHIAKPSPRTSSSHLITFEAREAKDNQQENYIPDWYSAPKQSRTNIRTVTNISTLLQKRLTIEEFFPMGDTVCPELPNNSTEKNRSLGNTRDGHHLSLNTGTDADVSVQHVNVFDAHETAQLEDVADNLPPKDLKHEKTVLTLHHINQNLDKTISDEYETCSENSQRKLNMNAESSPLRKLDTLILRLSDGEDHHDDDGCDDGEDDECKDFFESLEYEGEDTGGESIQSKSRSYKNLLVHPARFRCAICDSHLEIPCFDYFGPDFQTNFHSFDHGRDHTLIYLYCPQCCCRRSIYHPS